jgi:hypothetical protein
VGLILCLVGLLITLPAVQFIGTMIQSHLFGQIGAGAKSWQTSIVPEEYIPEPPAAPSVYETPVETRGRAGGHHAGDSQLNSKRRP